MQDADTTISAVFTAILYTLAYDQPAHGGGTISMAAGSYTIGESIHITVSPETDMRLKCLVINDVEYPSYAGRTSIDFTMPAHDVGITAIFELIS